jgi:hypothetical protein
MRDTSWRNARGGSVKYSDNASAFTSEHLKSGWILLSNCWLDSLRIPIVLIRPDGGVALFELPPGWTDDLLALFHRGLDRSGFSAAYPGHLPVIHRRLRREDIPHLDSILHEAFAFEEKIGIPPTSGWAERLQSMLAMAPPTPVAMAPAPPAFVAMSDEALPQRQVLLHPLIPAVLACGGVAAALLMWPTSWPRPREAETRLSLAATLPPRSAPAMDILVPPRRTPSEAVAVETGWPRWTATALAGAPAAENPPRAPMLTAMLPLPELRAIPRFDALVLAPVLVLASAEGEAVPQAASPAPVVLAGPAGGLEDAAMAPLPSLSAPNATAGQDIPAQAPLPEPVATLPPLQATILAAPKGAEAQAPQVTEAPTQQAAEPAPPPASGPAATDSLPAQAMEAAAPRAPAEPAPAATNNSVAQAMEAPALRTPEAPAPQVPAEPAPSTPAQPATTSPVAKAVEASVPRTPAAPAPQVAEPTPSAPAQALTNSPVARATEAPEPRTLQTPAPQVAAESAPSAPAQAMTNSPVARTTEAPEPRTLQTPAPQVAAESAPSAPAQAMTNSPVARTTEVPEPRTLQAPAPQVAAEPAPPAPMQARTNSPVAQAVEAPEPRTPQAPPPQMAAEPAPSAPAQARMNNPAARVVEAPEPRIPAAPAPQVAAPAQSAASAAAQAVEAPAPRAAEQPARPSTDRPAPPAARGPMAQAPEAAPPAARTAAVPPERPATRPDLPASPQPAVAESAMVTTMLRRAEALLSLGDISGARRFLERAEAAGSARAAVALAETYDPATLAGLQTRGLQPDPAAALAWYRRAAARGAPVAARIQALEAP